MKTKTLHTESSLLGLKVLKLENWENIEEVANFIPHEFPAYVYCEISATDLAGIHQIEQAGYRFSEFRIKSVLKTSESDFNTRGFFPFTAEIITENTLLDEAISILNQNPCDDRFSNDPFLKKDFAAMRNVQNLTKSFNSWPNEFLFGVFNSQTSELVAFRSGAIFNKTEAQLFQYGVAADTDFCHTAEMLEAFTIAYLKEKGVFYIHAVSTGFNIPELNRLIKSNGYDIVSSTMLLRKIFVQ